ncbi:MAG: sporulation protein YunB [Acutalibacteraceae bacterium]|nr:sporulation protein YunB [Acutalibacteraceae bacterium]
MTDTIRSELRRKFGKKYKCRNNTAKIIICILLVFCVAVLLLSALYIEKKVSPFMKQYTKLKAEQTMSELFSSTVENKMKELNITYEELTDSSFSNQGEIQMFNTDVVAVNKLKNEVTQELSEKLNNEYNYEVEIPLGSITDSEFLSGTGIKLKFNNTLTGRVYCEYRTEFESGGINQTLHRLYIDITGDLIVIAGGEQEPLQYTCSVLLGETVIVGHVPNTVY